MFRLTAVHWNSNLIPLINSEIIEIVGLTYAKIFVERIHWIMKILTLSDLDIPYIWYSIWDFHVQWWYLCTLTFCMFFVCFFRSLHFEFVSCLDIFLIDCLERTLELFWKFIHMPQFFKINDNTLFSKQYKFVYTEVQYKQYTYSVNTFSKLAINHWLIRNIACWIVIDISSPSKKNNFLQGCWFNWLVI